MRFIEFLISEAGQIRLHRPESFGVKIHGKVRMINGAEIVDPRFERMNVPNPPESTAKTKKFMGDLPFSLPIFDQSGRQTGYIVSKERMAMLGGSGELSSEPVGVVAPDNWGDQCCILDPNMEYLYDPEVTATHGGSFDPRKPDRDRDMHQPAGMSQPGLR